MIGTGGTLITRAGCTRASMLTADRTAAWPTCVSAVSGPTATPAGVAGWSPPVYWSVRAVRPGLDMVSAIGHLGWYDEQRLLGAVGLDPRAVLELVESGTLVRQKAAASVVAHDEGEHSFVGHEHQVVVAIQVAGVAPGMAMDLGDDSQAASSRRAGGYAGGDLVSSDVLWAAAASGLVAREDDGVVFYVPTQPPHKALMRSGVASSCA